MAIASPPQLAETPSFWLARSTRTIFFFAAMLTLAGIYLAFQVPISVFPETNFPRVVIGVDNGVMPVEQMEVTITRPIEDAVNSVPGLQTVRSTTSRGSAEVSLFFDWNEDMVLQLQLVDAALSKVRADAAVDGAHHHQPADLRDLSHSRLQPDLRHRAADAALGDCHLRSEAAAESRLRREHGDRAGRPGAGVSRGARTWPCCILRRHHHRPGQRDPGLEHRRLARPLRSQSPADPRPGGRAGARRRSTAPAGGEDHARRRSGAHRRRGHGGAGHHARLHHGHRQRQAIGAAQHRAPALEQHGRGGRCGGRAE